MVLTILDYSIETCDVACSCDGIRFSVSEFDTTSYPSVCGHSSDPVVIVAPSHDVIVTFYTDSSITLGGFQATFFSRSLYGELILRANITLVTIYISSVIMYD